jgi:hypothetical protein
MQRKVSRSLILILIITMIVTFSCNLVTFAIFNEEISKKDNLAFGKVELSSNTNVVLDSTTNIVGGEVISSAGFNFSKSSSSAPIYVRAKVAYYTSSTNIQAVNYTYMLRQYGLDVLSVPNASNTCYWKKIGIYYYLMNGEQLYSVSDDSTYSLTSSNTKFPNFYIDTSAFSGETIYFNLSFEAIQSQNYVSGTTFDNYVSYFDEFFGASILEKNGYSETVSSFDYSLSGESYIATIKSTATNIAVCPSTYSNKKVVEVDFNENSNIEMVVLPSSVSIIGGNASSSLKHIIYSKNLLTINSGVFTNATSLNIIVNDSSIISNLSNCGDLFSHANKIYNLNSISSIDSSILSSYTLKDVGNYKLYFK